ncbi:MAG: PHP domain-containing protein [Clostridia bacterium]|nr:PHP domain-containing protein [Clostridia bacterium]
MKFDLHIHSRHSHDSCSSVKNIIEKAKNRGLQGISITDHNSFNGSEEALMIAPKDMIIIPGVEYSTDQGHFLVYFLNKGLENQGLARDSRGRFNWKELTIAAHDQNALVFVAHPYKYSKKHDSEIWNHIDGIEVYNSRASLCRNVHANPQALEALSTYKKPFSAGSDSHWLGEVGNAYWECDILNETNSTEILQKIKSSLMDGTGRVWGSATHRLYEPASQIYKGIKSSKYILTVKPILKMIYSLVLECSRISGFGKKACEGWIDIESRKGGN